MKDRRIAVIAGFLIIAALWGFSYYIKKAPAPPTAEKQTSISSTTATGNKTAPGSAAAIEGAKIHGESMWLLFRSTTCVPCVEMQKIFDQLQPEYQGKVHFLAIDVNDRNNLELIKTWKIQYIPTTYVVDSTGKVSYQTVGVIPIEDLKKELNKVVE